MKTDLFNDLFVLELANNHWGDLRRGLRIIKTYSKLVKKYNINAAIKLQFRNAETIIHRDYRGRTDIRYIHRTEARILSNKAYRVLIDEIRTQGLITMSTPFDEESVDFCEELDIDIIKIASFDLNDWPLVDKVLEKKRPSIVSIGGTGIEDVDRIVELFNNQQVPLAINQCVSIYPSEPQELELNQIEFLIHRYPENIIGLSSHEYQDYSLSLAIAYGMGARTFERHIDIPHPTQMSVYNMLPEQCETWFKTFQMIKTMYGKDTGNLRIPPCKEIEYINEHIRGLYAKRDLICGECISLDNFYMAIPIHKCQLSCREVGIGGVLNKNIKKDEMVTISDIDADYLNTKNVVSEIQSRGRILEKNK